MAFAKLGELVPGITNTGGYVVLQVGQGDAILQYPDHLKCVPASEVAISYIELDTGLEIVSELWGGRGVTEENPVHLEMDVNPELRDKILRFLGLV